MPDHTADGGGSLPWRQWWAATTSETISLRLFFRQKSNISKKNQTIPETRSVPGGPQEKGPADACVQQEEALRPQQGGNGETHPVGCFGAGS